MTKIAFNMPYTVELPEEDRYGRPLLASRMGRVVADIPEMDAGEFSPRVRMEGITYLERDGLLWAAMAGAGGDAVVASLEASSGLVGHMDFRTGGRAVEVNPFVVDKSLFTLATRQVSNGEAVRVERDRDEMAPTLLASREGKAVLARTRDVVVVDGVFLSRRHGPVRHYNIWPNKYTKSGLNGTWDTADRGADSMSSIFDFGMQDTDAMDAFLARRGMKPFLFYGHVEPVMLSDAPVKDVLLDLAIERNAFAVLAKLDESPAEDTGQIAATIRLRNALQERFPGQSLAGRLEMNSPRPSWDTAVPDASGILDLLATLEGLPEDLDGMAKGRCAMLSDRRDASKPSFEDDAAAMGAAFR